MNSETSGEQRTTCCIVGGGPAGMMLGLLLARTGIDVTVLEKHADFLRDFRGDTIHAATLRVLDQLGLGAEFAALPQRRLDRMRMHFPDRTVTAADFSRLPGPYRYLAMVPQWDFLDLLSAAACEQPSFRLRMSTAATGLAFDTSGRVTGVHYREQDGAAGTLSAHLTVACDGRDSTVRARAGLHQRPFEVPMDVWAVRIPVQPERGGSESVSLWFSRGQHAVTIDRGDYYQTTYLIPKGADEQLRARGLAEFRGRLAELLGWAPDRLDGIESWDQVKLLEVTMGRLPQWYRDGLLCLGDAAHTMSPVGGVGVNLALQDAVAAATILAQPLADRAVTTCELARVQRRRQLPTAAMQTVQRMDHRMLLGPALRGTLSGPPLSLRLVHRLPLLGAAIAYYGGYGIRPEQVPDFAKTGAR